MTKNIVYVQKENYTFSMDLQLPSIEYKKYLVLSKQQHTEFSFPTRFLLTSGKEHIIIELCLFGFGLTLYLRSRDERVHGRTTSIHS